MKKAIMTAVTVLSTVLLSCPSAARAQSGAVSQWHSHAQTLVAAFTGRGNAAQAYTLALIQVAVYDATVAIGRARATGKPAYKPFIADVVAPAEADLRAAIGTAAFHVGHERVNSNAKARAEYRNAYDVYMATIPDGPAKRDGTAVGEAVARAVLAARAQDNFYNTATFSNPPAGAGTWQAVSTATPWATAGASDYAMAFTVPLTAATPQARRLPPPPSLTSAAYRRDLEETKHLGGLASESRTPAMTDVVQFWTESGFTLWSRNLRAIVDARRLDEFDTARALAALAVATGEAMLGCFEAKYAYLHWRPWQANQHAGMEGQAAKASSSTWTPTVRANHPEYPAGHGCYAGAATKALELLFGDFAVTLTSTGSQVAGWPAAGSARYDRLGRINDDNANARVWGGLHWRTTMERSATWSAQVVADAICGEFGLSCSKPRFDGR